MTPIAELIPLNYFLVLGTLLFGIGLFGALKRTNAIMILMSIELMLNAVNINVVAFSRYLTPDPTRGFIFTLFIITVAAAEAAVGLAIVLVIVRRQGLIDINKINLLKG